MSGATRDRAHQRWSTADVEPQRALAYWIDTVCNSFLQMNIDSPARAGFRAQLDRSELGPATLYALEADAQTVRRTRERIAHSNHPGCILMQMRAGDVRLLQHGRESHLRPGDCVLIDCTEPYRLDCMPATRSIVLRFPQDWLKAWIPFPEDITGRRFPATSGWSAALSTALANLDPRDASEHALSDSVIAEQIAALLALAAGPAIAPTGRTDPLFSRLRDDLRERCHEFDLRPGAIADAQGISKRYLHYLFAQHGLTFCGELLRLRLETATRLLRDQRFAATSISEIAARSGFVDPSHFARCFRKTFGVAPKLFRGRNSPIELRVGDVPEALQ